MRKRGFERTHFLFELRRYWHGRSSETGLCGVSLITERGTTLTRVKVPKYWLSVKLKCVFEHRQQEGRLRTSHPLKSA